MFTCGVLDFFMDHGIRFPFTAVVILTRNRGYRKKEGSMPLSKLFYPKFPELQKALAERNSIYNKTMDLIERLEDEDRITVIRPTKSVVVGRMEKDTDKLRALYDEGYSEAEKAISLMVSR